MYIYIYTYGYSMNTSVYHDRRTLSILLKGRARTTSCLGRNSTPLNSLLPVVARCYISCFRCIVRNPRCNTMSHLSADAVSLCISRAKRLMYTMSHLAAAGCMTP